MSSDESERYRKAAHAALKELDWCIDYLHGIHQKKIAAQLGKNRESIKRRMHEPTDSVPSPAKK